MEQQQQQEQQRHEVQHCPGQSSSSSSRRAGCASNWLLITEMQRRQPGRSAAARMQAPHGSAKTSGAPGVQPWKGRRPWWPMPWAGSH